MQPQAGLVATLLVLSLVGPVAATAPTTTCAFPVTVTDRTGTAVTVEREPDRVVTLAPSAAQTMWEIGAREKVVGLTKHASYLEGAESRTQVSTAEQLVSVEAVVGAEPDLVLAPHLVSNETVERLRSAGVTVYAFGQAATIEDVYAKTRLTGRLTGECTGAEETVSWMRERIGVVREAVDGQERPDVLYLFFGFTAGRGTFIDEIVQTAGGSNVAAAVNVSGYRQLSPEVVVREDPDWIVVNSENPMGLDGAAYNQTTAAKRNQTLVVQIEHVNQPAPRIVHAITLLAEHFHPDAYAAANATATRTATPTAAATEPSPTVTAPAEQTEAPGQDGFGALLAVIGLAAAVFARR